jgi:membrane associated rhomboid family serine protease
VGIYDRDYYREEQRQGPFLHAPTTIVGALIAVNVVLWIADYIISQALGRPAGALSYWMAVHNDTLKQPWLWWQFLTAGFAHSPDDFQHILFNMLGLFFLGRDVEEVYGRKEFLRLYLTMIVVGFLTWNLLNLPTQGDVMALGASGAIAGIVVLYALNFPRRTLLLFFVIPVPAWLVGVMLVVYNMFGAGEVVGRPDVAYSVHLAGAAFAFIYYQRGWNLSRLNLGRVSWPTFRRKPRLKVHKPEEESSDDLSAEVDRILEKIYREGEASLTPKERKTLETASREYQRKKATNPKR